MDASVSGEGGGGGGFDELSKLQVLKPKIKKQQQFNRHKPNKSR